MLFRPVYLKGKKMQEAITPVMAALKKEMPPPPPPMPEPPEPYFPPEPKRTPLLIEGDNGCRSVFPKEATRDVLAGKIDYMLIDRNGMTMFKAKHSFFAMKYSHGRIEKVEDYACMGGHERVFAEKEKQRQGRGYRRKYISPELIGQGIYGDQMSFASNELSEIYKITVAAIVLMIDKDKKETKKWKSNFVFIDG